MRLRGKTAIVFGAGPNIGGTIALFLAREGASVVVSDLNPAVAQATADRIVRDGSKPTSRRSSPAPSSGTGTSISR